MLKYLWIASLVAAFLVAASGLSFVSSYEISSTQISVIEASIIQIAHTRYLIASVLLLISAIFYSSFSILGSLNGTIGKTITKTAQQEII